MENKSFSLSRIKIKRLFGNKNIDWKLYQDVNILGGINGSGKSTILKCVNSILQNEFLEEDTLKLVDSIELFFANDIVVKWNKFVCNRKEFIPEKDCSYSYSGLNKEGLVTIQKIQVEQNGEKIDFEDLKKKLNVYFISTFDTIILKDVSDILENKDIKTNLDLMIHNQIVKRNGLIVESVSMYRDEIKKESIDEFAKNYKELFLEKVIDDVLAKKDINVLTKINDKDKLKQFVLDFFKDEENSVRTFFEEKMREIVKKKVISEIYEYLDSFFVDKTSIKDTGSFDFLINNSRINYLQLSTGEKQLLYILLVVFNTNKKTCILLMDEPDLGLHVIWKEKFVSILRKINPNAQIILTTHAPSMVRGWVEHVKEVKQITVK
ncbi:AAA family ATPase [Parabacteroides distasonis]|uniref:AAA family ATPase n=1 Tax=Parabacteroides distasonis TaxID=823 RepID=UPI0036F2B964